MYLIQHDNIEKLINFCFGYPGSWLVWHKGDTVYI